jgi:hypothetical protein
MTMTAKRIDIKDYCDSLYTELFDIKLRLGEFLSTIDQIEGKKSGVLSSYGRHLHELISFIDWKLQIFNKVCPVDWSKFSHDVEGTVSVPPVESLKVDETAGGYVGG